MYSLNASLLMLVDYYQDRHANYSQKQLYEPEHKHMQISVVIRGRSLWNNGRINCRYLRVRQNCSTIMVPVTIATIKVMRHLCLLDVKIVLAECLAFDNARYSVCDLHTCCPQKLYLARIICLQHTQVKSCAVCFGMTHVHVIRLVV